MWHSRRMKQKTEWVKECLWTCACFIFAVMVSPHWLSIVACDKFPKTMHFKYMCILAGKKMLCVCVCARAWERERERQRVYASELKLMVCAGWHNAQSKSGPSLPITRGPWAARTVLMFLSIYEQACMNTVIYPLPALNKHWVAKEVRSCKCANEWSRECRNLK